MDRRRSMTICSSFGARETKKRTCFFSTATHNLSRWLGGRHRCGLHNNDVSVGPVSNPPPHRLVKSRNPARLRRPLALLWALSWLRCSPALSFSSVASYYRVLPVADILWLNTVWPATCAVQCGPSRMRVVYLLCVPTADSTTMPKWPYEYPASGWVRTSMSFKVQGLVYLRDRYHLHSLLCSLLSISRVDAVAVNPMVAYYNWCDQFSGSHTSLVLGFGNVNIYTSFHFW